MQAQNLGSSLVVKLISEMGHLINNFYLCSDSKVSVFWVLHNNPNRKLQVFLENRAKTIKGNFNAAQDDLRTQHKDLELDTNVAKSVATVIDYQTQLLWVPAGHNTADTRSKYQKFGRTVRLIKIKC